MLKKMQKNAKKKSKHIKQLCKPSIHSGRKTAPPLDENGIGVS